MPNSKCPTCGMLRCTPQVEQERWEYVCVMCERRQIVNVKKAEIKCECGQVCRIAWEVKA